MFEKTEKLLSRFLDMGVPGYDLMVLRDGECIYRKLGGYSDLQNKISMTGKERYNIYSCSKMITCVAALQLYEKGAFSLDDKLSDFIPEFKEMMVKTPDGLKKAENPILIKHLFGMSAGFSYNTNSQSIRKAIAETGGDCNTVDVIRYLAEEPLLFEPGTDWEYSLCHDVLAAVVEVVSKERFGQYVQKNIFEPLNMTRSTFMLPDEELDTIAPQYVFDGTTKTAVECQNKKKISSYKFGKNYESGGAGAISTVEDYVKFLEAIRKGDIILKKETIDLLLCDTLCPEDRVRKKYCWYPAYGFGLGIRTPINNGVTDFGWGGAAGAYYAVDRENKITMYYAQHLLASPNKIERYILYSTIKEDILGEKIDDVEFFFGEKGMPTV